MASANSEKQCFTQRWLWMLAYKLSCCIWPGYRLRNDSAVTPGQNPGVTGLSLTARC